jgi:hypothetical protein
MRGDGAKKDGCFETWKTRVAREEKEAKQSKAKARQGQARPGYGMDG